MAATKLQVGIVSVIVLASVMTPLVLHHRSLVKLREENMSASSKSMSNLLARVASGVRTNDMVRTNVFIAATLQDVGLQTPDSALQTILRAFVSSEPGAMQEILDPDSPMLKEGGMDILEKQKALLQHVSEIDLLQKRDNLDRSVDFTCELKGGDGAGGMSPTHLLLHLRPSDQGWRLYSYSAPMVVLSK
jgi:hypothetical protein